MLKGEFSFSMNLTGMTSRLGSQKWELVPASALAAV